MRSTALHLFLLAALAGACSPFQPYRGPVTDSGIKLVEGVPFHAQENTRDCGPAALTSVLAHRGHQVSVVEVRSATYDPRIGGTLIADLENYSRSLGFETSSGSGDLALLRASVDADRPVIVLTEYGAFGMRSPHYLVIYGYGGYGPERFLVHAGVAESVLVEAQDLDRRWAKMNRLYLALE